MGRTAQSAAAPSIARQHLEKGEKLLDTAEATGRRLLYEATVGAGLPVIDTFRKLVASGDVTITINDDPDKGIGTPMGKTLLAALVNNDILIPSACGGWDETRAAYRLFDHPEVTAQQVLEPHYRAGIEIDV